MYYSIDINSYLACSRMVDLDSRLSTFNIGLIVNRALQTRFQWQQKMV